MWCGVFSTIPPREIFRNLWLSDCQVLCLPFEPCLTIFIASYFNKRAEWKLTRFDLTCGALSLIGLVLWYITKSGNVAIVFSILADGLAALPTVVKSFNFPETESGWPYFTSTISAAITLLTVKVWDLANVGFPLYILIVTFVISVLVQFKLGKVYHFFFS